MATPTPTPPVASQPTLTSMEQDELTMRQQEEIEREISNSTPLLTPPLPITTLLTQYCNDAVYSQKVNDLSNLYSQIRKTRPDGNCFFRAFLYGLFEHFVGDEQFRNNVQVKLEHFKDVLKTAGYVQFTVEDFYDNFVQALNTLREVKKEDILTTHFADAAHSDYLIVFLRLLTSAELRNNAEFYQNFLTEGQTVQEFTQFEVEPMYKESDHIQIVALAAVFNIGVTVVYLDRGDGIQTHPFQEEAQGKRITMLYRPGHYDLIY